MRRGKQLGEKVGQAPLRKGARVSYKWVKTMARELGVHVDDLIALTNKYDPFYAGRPSDVKKAKWAKRIWDWTLKVWETKRYDLLALGYHVGEKPHARGIHYLYFTGHPNPKLPNGTPYLGTEKNWKTLVESLAKAKVLGLIPFGYMTDKKHPEVVENLRRTPDEEPTLPEEGSFDGVVSPDDVEITISGGPDIEEVSGDMKKSVTKRLPYHNEIWDEKGSKLVDQVASRFYANVQHSVGEQTYEPVYELLKRAKAASGGRPVRIFYLSDYDPRGKYTIPVSVARKIEWYVQNLEEFKGMDIKLKKIALTREQVEKLKLPPAPVKASEPMLKRWKQAEGEYIVELDALESLHPGEFVKNIERELGRYYDKEAAESIRAYNQKVNNKITGYNEAVEEAIGECLDKVEVGFVDPKFEIHVSTDLERELEELRNLIESWQAPKWKDPTETDEEWLYDSGRDYMAQLKRYKKERGDDRE